nr:mannonate dehydratase [Rhizobium sp. WYCCWR 11146]
MLAEQGAAKTAENGLAHPLRPAHGHELVNDGGRGTHPGYPLVGRLKGLAELRGVMTAIARN